MKVVKRHAYYTDFKHKPSIICENVSEEQGKLIVKCLNEHRESLYYYQLVSDNWDINGDMQIGMET